ACELVTLSAPMKLYLMRHGPAEDEATTRRDADRELTPIGRERVTSVARELVKLNELPQFILSSPFARATQTARIVADVTGVKEYRTRRELAMSGPATEVVYELVRAAYERTMLVGHQPDLSMLVGKLAGHDTLLENLGGVAKGMVLALEVLSTGTARL